MKQIQRVQPLAILFLLFLIVSDKGYSQYTEIRGRVIDSKQDSANYAVAYANLRLKGTLAGTTTDADGFFYLRTAEKGDSLIVTYIGYKRLAIPIKRGKSQELKIDMGEKGITLKIVEVKSKRGRIKKDTIAEYVYHQVVDNKKNNREENLQNYTLKEYNKLTIGIVNPKQKFLNWRILRPFKFVLENRDTTRDSSVSIPFLMKEDVVNVSYRKAPKSTRRVTTATQFTGIDNNSLGDIVSYTFDKIDIYDDLFVIVGKSFLSPFAPGALVSYRYFILDTQKLDGRVSYKINFVGKVNKDLQLKGYAWIDSATWAIKSIYFRPNEKSNLNYLKDYNISQTFKLVDNKSWMLVTEDLQTVGTIFKRAKNQSGLILRKHLSRKDIKINQQLPDSLFKGIEQEIITEDAREQPRAGWDSIRLDTLSRVERRLLYLHDTIPKVPAYKAWMWTINLFSTADFKAGPVEFGRFYKFVSKNNVEGVRLRLGIQTNTSFSKKFHFFGYGAYGLKDKVFKYNAEIDYMLPSKNEKWCELLMSYTYDLNVLGQTNNLLTFDNFLTLLSAAPKSKLMKIRDWNVSIENEWLRGFTSIISVDHKTYYDIPGVFDFNVQRYAGDRVGKHLNDFETFEVGIDSRYTHKEKYLRYGGFYRLFIATKNPTFTFKYNIGAINMDGKRDMYQKFQIGIKQRLSWRLGHTWYSVDAGKILGASPYPTSYVTPGGLGYLFNNKDYNMLGEFEFVTDQYLSFFLEHHFEGFFFNKIPYFNRLQLREVVYTRGLWGSYSQNNLSRLLPGNNLGFSSPSAYPYVEAGVGIENIFKIIRIDSIWRLTYRDKVAVPNWAIKIGFNIVI